VPLRCNGEDFQRFGDDRFRTGISEGFVQLCTAADIGKEDGELNARTMFVFAIRHVW
jgi:hypothetical protein